MTAVALSNLLWKYLTQGELSTARCYSLVDDLQHSSVSEAVECIVLMDLRWQWSAFNFSLSLCHKLNSFWHTDTLYVNSYILLLHICPNEILQDDSVACAVLLVLFTIITLLLKKDKMKVIINFSV
jgi:hypothetical protein